MRHNKRWLIGVLIVLLFLGIGFLVYIVPMIIADNGLKEQELIRKEALQREDFLKNVELDRQKREEESESLKQLNIYEKLDQSIYINTLIMSNHLVREDGFWIDMAPWQEYFTNILNNIYGSKSKTEYLNLFQDNIAFAWKYYNFYQKGNDIKYDLAIIDSHLFNQIALTDQEFSVAYEGLIRDLKEQNSEMLIINMINYGDNEQSYIEVIHDLSERYGLIVADMNDMAHGDIKFLDQEDDINDNGYRLYGRQLVALIGLYDRSLLNQSIDGIERLYPDGALGNYRHLKPEVFEGFQPFGDTYIGYQEGDEIIYEGKGSYFLFTYITAYEGGQLDLYLDGELIRDIDTRNDEMMMKTLMLPIEPMSYHELKVTIDYINPVDTRHSVHILGVASSE